MQLEQQRNILPIRVLIFISIMVLPIKIYATQPKQVPARVAIVIDDIGYNRKAGEKALALPGQLTYAIIPFTPFAKTLGQQAHEASKEIMIHLPMESASGNRLGTGGITSMQSKLEVKRRVRNALKELPHAAGLNNHMGSLLTTDELAMDWIMQELANTESYFIDSMTNANSIASLVAEQYGIPNSRRDVFIDATPTEPAISHQFQLLLQIARERGHAIGIAHPYPATLQFLEKALPDLTRQNVELVAASQIIKETTLRNDFPDISLSTQAIIQSLAGLPSPKSRRLWIR